MDVTVDLRNIGLTLNSASGAVNILRDVNLKLHAAESTAMVGPSGSGKTSTLLLTAGLEAPTSGEVNVLGQDITRISEDELAILRRQHFGIVFQSFHLVPTMTALENVAIPLELAGKASPDTTAREMLEMVGLKDRVTHYPSQLSGGEQQRVAIARAFATRPKIILADEPTGNLDTETGERIMALLFQMQKEHGASLLLITHDSALAKRCDRVVHIQNGTITQ